MFNFKTLTVSFSLENVTSLVNEHGKIIKLSDIPFAQHKAEVLYCLGHWHVEWLKLTFKFENNPKEMTAQRLDLISQVFKLNEDGFKLAQHVLDSLESHGLTIIYKPYFLGLCKDSMEFEIKAPRPSKSNPVGATLVKEANANAELNRFKDKLLTELIQE